MILQIVRGRWCNTAPRFVCHSKDRLFSLKSAFWQVKREPGVGVENLAFIDQSAGAARARSAYNVSSALCAWDSSVSARMVADMLGWVEVGFVVLASVVAQYLYIVLLLEHTTQTEPYFLAGIVCALLFRHFQWKRGLNEVAILQQGARQWRSVLGSLSLAFLVLIATAYAFKLSALFSRGWLICWFMLACAMLVVGRALSRYLLLSLAKTGRFRRRVAVASFGGPTQSLLQAIEREPSTRLVGTFAIDPVRIVAHAGDPARFSGAPGEPDRGRKGDG